MSVEFDRRKNKATQLFFPLQAVGVSSLFSGTVWASLTNKSIVAYRYADDQAPTAQSLNAATVPVEEGTTGLWKLSLLAADLNIGSTYEDLLIKIDADEINPQVLIIRTKQRLSAVDWVNEDGGVPAFNVEHTAAATSSDAMKLKTIHTASPGLNIDAALSNCIDLTGFRGVFINSDDDGIRIDADEDGIDIVGDTYGVRIVANGGNGIDVLASAVGMSLNGGSSDLSTGEIDTLLTDVAAILVDTGTDIPALIAALNNISTTDVKTQVDNALGVDTISELPVAQPPKNPTLLEAIMLAYMVDRNETEQSATEYKVKNDAGTDIAKAPYSQGATSAVRGQMVSG